MSIRVILADDHREIRASLCHILEMRPSVEVVAQARDGESTVRQTRRLKPDIVVMDVKMPKMDGIEATRQILEAVKNTRIIALSMYLDRRYVLEMLKSGASGYLLKDNVFDDIGLAFETALSGKIYLSPRVAKIILLHVGQINDISEIPSLTKEERWHLQLLTGGTPTRQIAVDMEKSKSSVEKCWPRIFSKLHADSPDLLF